MFGHRKHGLFPKAFPYILPDLNIYIPIIYCYNNLVCNQFTFIFINLWPNLTFKLKFPLVTSSTLDFPHDLFQFRIPGKPLTAGIGPGNNMPSSTMSSLPAALQLHLAGKINSPTAGRSQSPGRPSTVTGEILKPTQTRAGVNLAVMKAMESNYNNSINKENSHITLKLSKFN